MQTQLDAAQSHLDLVADYGTLRIIATPLFWLLNRVHSLVGNWGFAIIIVTMLLKLLFYPLVGSQRAFDGEDEGARAAAEQPARDLQGRSREAQSRHDGAVQA